MKHFFLLILYFIALANLAAQSTQTFSVDVLRGIRNGDIVVTHSNTDIGVIENAFDGLLNGPVARSAAINPMVVTLRFNYTIALTETAVYTDNIESGVWTVEIANTPADLDAQTGSYQKIVNNAAYNPQVLSNQTVTASGKMLRLTMNRLTGDNYVHLHEWGIVATANITVSSICMKPNQVRLIPNANFQPQFYGTDTDGNEWPLPAPPSLTSTNPSVVAVNASGVFSAPGNVGEANVTASWQGLNLQTNVKVVSDFVSPSVPKKTVKVAMVIIDPAIPAAGGQRFSERFWANNGGPMALAQQTRDSLFSVSGGTIDVQFTETHWETDLSLNRFGGHQISVDSMYRLFLEPGWTTLRTVAELQSNSVFQYNDLLSKYNLCEKSNAKQIDEIWVWAMPFIGMWESNMAGTGAFWINGPVISGNSCTDLVSVMGFNYERYAGCALHNYTHRIELTMAKVYNTTYNYVPTDPPYPPGPKDPWRLFVNYDALAGEAGNAHIGNGHFPPNAIENYGYSNHGYVPSHEPNWKRYPLLFDQTKQINCEEWGCEGDCGINYCSWWLRHLPHFKCKDQYGRLNNWWTYIFDYNEGKQQESQLDDCNCQMFADDPTANCASKGDFPWHEWIAGVKVANLNKTSGKSQYSNFAASTANMTPGTLYPVELTVGYSFYTYDEYARIWIDLNNDQIYGDNEVVWQGKLNRPADGTPTALLTGGGITIPIGTTAGSHMMRVSLKRGAYAGPCETIPFGEVEDYTVTVSTALPDIASPNWEFIPPSYTVCYLSPGQTMGFYGATLVNFGPAATGPFTAVTVLSKDNVFSANDVVWQTFNYPNGFDPTGFGNYTGSLNITAPLPNVPPGIYNAITVLDPNNQVAELNETNNTHSDALRIGAPDLTVTGVTGVPSAAATGDPISALIEIKNIDPFPAHEFPAGFNVELYWSTDNQYQAGVDQKIGFQLSPYADFNSGGFLYAIVQATVPTGISAGTYYVIPVANTTCDRNAGNNSGTAIPVQVTVGKPDLIATGWEIIPGVGGCYTPPGQSMVFFGATILNQGNALAGGFSVRSVFSKDPTPSIDDTPWHLSVYTGLAPGGSVSYSATTPFPAALPLGPYYILTIVDANFSVSESNENNNVTAEYSGAGAPNFTVDGFVFNNIPLTATAGVSFNFVTQIKNNNAFPAHELLGNIEATIYLSTDNQLQPGTDVQIGTISAPNAQFSPTFQLNNAASTATVPSGTTAGNYYLFVVIGGACETLYSDNTSSAVPIQVITGQPVPYCASKGTAPWEDWIAEVKLTDLDKTSGKSQYSDFTASVANVASGLTYPMGLRSAFSYTTYDEYWKVWIDYNRNGIFEEVDETAVSAVLSKPANGTASVLLVANASIKAGILLGFSTRMRVSMKRGSYPTPCETFANGEVEDYKVFISPGGATPKPDLTAANFTAGANGQQGAVTPYSFDLINAGTAAATGNYTVGAFLSADNQWSTGDVLVGIVPTGNTAVGTITNVQGAITVPSNQPVGNYYLLLVVDKDAEIAELDEGNNVLSRPFEVKPGINPGVYCTSKSDYPWEDWISAVKVGTVQKSSGKSPYSDFTATAFMLTKSAPTSVALTTTWSYYTFDEYWRIWIDYNHNNQFDEPGELAFSGILNKPANGSQATKTLSGSISVPASALTGATRMRVSMKRGAFPLPCETMAFGEVEDYTVNIAASFVAGEDRMTQPEPSVQLFPNPAESSVVFNLTDYGNKPVVLSVFNTLGAPVCRKEYSALHADFETVELGDLPSGQYWVRVETAGWRPVFRVLVVERR